MQGRLKCNVDASFYNAAGVTGWGLCVRDYQGCFVSAASNYIQQRLNTIEGEAVAFKEAIREVLVHPSLAF
ncbi:hypothetical protein L195_g037061 [Trifolium pratense]|uniref:RNase H type-1 domain-containing protein n=1 Tax=Trifolium pratense TaxID=57577 RepID=A0A2K3LR75_TRIPR|nr:hypothetical protein L195_g037061 [Trifolium pratense]